MTLRAFLAMALAVALFGVAPPLPTLYSAPAGLRPAGIPSANRPYDAILPDGRIVAPIGRSVALGEGARGMALSPDGRYAVVTDSGPLQPALIVVNLARMTIASAYDPQGAQFFSGIAALHDPADPAATLVLASGGASGTVRFLHLDRSGTLHDLGSPVDLGEGVAGAIALAPDHRTAYVLNVGADGVAAIDLQSRALVGKAATGYAPFGAVVVGNRLFVTDPGLMHYTPQAARTANPVFAVPQFDEARASALSVLDLGTGGVPDAGADSSVRMDGAPNALDEIGGAHPSAIAISKNHRYAYVCMTGVDRIAVVSLKGTPRVVSGLQLQLFEKAPYGTRPDAIALSPNGKRIYVALAGINALAVLDARNPEHLHRLGLIPTGWDPSAIAVSHSGRFVYVANTQGAEGSSTLQRIDLRHLPLEKTTISALRYNRSASRPAANSLVPPLRSGLRSDAIEHVVSITLGASDYGGAFGNLPNGQAIMPNLRELAYRYGTAVNFYSQPQRGDPLDPFVAADDPQAYARSGYLFNALARAGLSYRDYGALLDVDGYAPDSTPGEGLGGTFSADVPVLAALGGHIDLDYPAWNPRITDLQRAQAFIADYGTFEKSAAVPAFSEIVLPPENDLADEDRALGRIVDYLSHQPSWDSSAIFISTGSPREIGGAGDSRTYAVVVSPYAKPHYVGAAHLCTAGVLKTEEELLGLPPLALGDLLATDLSDFFTTQADATPYTER